MNSETWLPRLLESRVEKPARARRTDKIPNTRSPTHVSPRPVIFISAVSRELKSARQLVANTLAFLGYEPEWQDIFGTEEGDLRAMLRRRIDASHGVVRLLGKCYGAEPPGVDEQFGRVSYTQYEALYAASKGKRVWYILG